MEDGASGDGSKVALKETDDSLPHPSIVGICCLQETKLRDDDSLPLNFPGFNLVKKNRPRRGGGGIAVLIHLSIPFINVDTSPLLSNDNFTELQAVTIYPDTSPLTIINAYIPPASSPLNRQIDFDAILNFTNNDFLFVGDLNAHHGLWSSGAAADARGGRLADSISSSTAACQLSFLRF